MILQADCPRESRRPLRFHPVALLAAAFLAAVSTLGSTRNAHADEIAPELETQSLKQRAKGEFDALVARLSANDRRRLTGVYLAFDSNPSDASAMVACDADGDFVVVVSEAMLKLASNVARAQGYDEANRSRRIEDYAEFLARSQIPGRRLIPPPPGFYTAQNESATYGERLSESLSFVLARELVHLRAGDLQCPHPTATREHGDDEWTDAEQRRALESATGVYPGRPVERDAEAAARLLDVRGSEAGALGLLRFFAQIELERTTYASRFVSTYLAQHPSATTRIATVRGSADTWRETR